MIFYFIWGGKQEKVNRKTMYLPIKEGGVGLVNIYNKYLALFLNQMMKVFLIKSWSILGELRPYVSRPSFEKFWRVFF